MTSEEFKIKGVRLAMTQDLWVPKAYKNEAGKPKKYKCKLLVPKFEADGKTPGIAAAQCIAKIRELARAAWKDKADIILKQIAGNKQNFAFLDGDLSLYEGFPGNWSLAVSRREEDRAPIFRKANPGTKDNPNIAGPAELYSGAYVVASISFWTLDKEGHSMHCNLHGLQQMPIKGEAFAGGGIHIQPEFESLEDTPDTIGAAAGSVDPFA